MNVIKNQNIYFDKEKLSNNEMQEIQGGLNQATCTKANKALNTIAFVAGVGSCFGPIGLAIFGPTAIIVSGISLACAYS